MNTTQVKIKDIKPYGKNPNRHPQWQIDALKSSIREFGFTIPIVVRKGVIIAGEGRWLAAKQLDMSEIPAIIRDDLTEEQANKLRLADIKISRMGEIDHEKFMEELQSFEQKQMEALGFGQEYYQQAQEEHLANKIDAQPNINIPNVVAGLMGKTESRSVSDGVEAKKAKRTIKCPECGAEFE